MTDPHSSRDLHPIELTVHKLPDPAASTPDETARTRRGRRMLLLLLLICAAPILLSYLTYYVIRPQGRMHHGELIEPQRDLPQWSATDLQGRAFPLTQLTGQWLLVSVGSGACSESCERMLFVQRQLHKMLNKDSERVDRVWLLTDDVVPAPALLQSIEGATVLKVAPDLLSQWLVPVSGQTLPDNLYLVDPLGRWMMRFPQAQDAQAVAGIRRDLERLMRASASWDKPGR